MNEDALPDNLKKKSILYSVSKTDIKTITSGSTSHPCNQARMLSRMQRNPPKFAKIGD